jgi:hypothetical protein
VSWEGEVKLLDFGIARAAAESQLSNYKEGMLMGKLGYVAPEQASLEKRWDHRVDIFAAGIILYELLTKQKPFPKATDVDSLIESRRAKVVPPSAIDPRLPKDVDAIVAKALAYEPEDRYADARSFADALVDVLFPTPHSTIQDHLGQQMKQVFAEKIANQRKGRAHDPLIMKVLTNAAEMRAQAEGGQAPAMTPSPGAFPAIDRGPDPVLQAQQDAARAARRAPRVRVVHRGVRIRWVLLVGLLLGAGGAAGAHFGAPWLRPGVVLVTSEPPGLEVSLDGRKTGQLTPTALERVVLSRPHVISVSGPAVREVAAQLAPRPGELVGRVHLVVPSSVGALVIESVPPGAEIVLDDRPAGRTPATLSGVRLDQRHRIDLVLPGHEIDQFVVLPERDGVRFSRRLSRQDQAGRAPGAPPR